MSRRKQPKPRHIETEDEITQILVKDHKEMPSESPCQNEDAAPVETLGTDNDTEVPSSPTPTPPGGDAHVCGKCREEFIGLSDFIAHKKVCSKKKVVVFFDANENENYPTQDRLGFERYRNLQEVGLLSEEGSDGEGNMDQSEEEEENDLQIDENEADDDLKFSSFNDDSADDFNDSDDEDDENDTSERELEQRALMEKYELAHQLPNLMFPFSQFMPNNNVVLEPLGETKAAVAQFAENNLSPSDLAVLHTTLYSLQQQQLVQLQLIQQLQQQLLMGGQMPSIPSSYLPLLSSGNFVPPTSSLLPITSSTTSLNSTATSADVKKSTSTSEPEGTATSSASSSVPVTVATSKCSTPPATSVDSSLPTSQSTSSTPVMTSSVTSSSSSTPTSVSVPMSMPLPSTEQITSCSSPVPTSDFARLSKMVEHSQYVSDDPFFRHKCRLCHKVFGSDSALQIHVRSHTGERPFKCNICGNRFSTRGNLKVHFERHRIKYPHIKMNPNPVPEYLDKMPMQPLPFMGPSFLGGPPMPPMPSMPPTLPTSMFHLTPSISAPLPSFREEPLPMHSKSMIEDHHLSSPASSTKSLTSPIPTATEISERKSPSSDNTASLAVSSSSNSVSPIMNIKPEQKMPSQMPPLSPQVTPSHFPLMTSRPSVPPPPPLTPTIQFDRSSPDSLVPSKMLESDVSDEHLELYMEIDKSETSKLQQLVDNIENKMTDPNQCVICHRVLSCKSALQMHYRTHTGERPFRCKICNRAFTTKGNLKTHMGVHRMKPPLRMMHQCPVCHKSFTNLLVLQQHIRSHAGVPGPLPGMSHFGPFPHPPTSNWPMKMFDVPGSNIGHSEHSMHPDKELDLSKSSSMYNLSSKKINDMGDDVSNDDDIESGVDDYVDEEEMLEDELTEEKEKELQDFDEHPSGDSGAGSEEGRPGSAEEETKTPKPTDDSKRENYNADHSDSVSEDSGRSASPKFDDRSPINPESTMYPSLATSHSSPVFSTSLAALEERVRAIDSSMAQSPLNRFRPAFAMNGALPPMTNGVRSPSPNSQFGSECGSEVNDRSNPGTPALSIRSECSSVGSGIGLGALDLRGNMDKSTTCHVCFKAFACRSALDIHLRSHTKERPYKCHVCDRHFSTKGNMRQHMLTHKIRDLPSSSFNNTDDENMNDSNSRTSDSGNNSEMPPEKKLKLEGDSNSQTSKSNSISKSDSSPFVHNNSTPLKHACKVCNKGFSSHSALQIHFRTHTGDKPFKCDVCGKAFTTRGNLKVHHGTHMWNNSPSRRGRRMSIEPPYMLSHKDNPYLPPGFPHRAPDFFPFHFPFHMTGPAPPKLNEISVIQSLAGGMGHFPPMPTPTDLTSPKSNSESRSKSEGQSWNSDNEKHESKLNVSGSGELDLSMKSTSSSGSPNNNITSPDSVSSWSTWKTTCHLCNKNFPSPPALEHHMQSYHLNGQQHKAIVA